MTWRGMVSVPALLLAVLLTVNLAGCGARPGPAPADAERGRAVLTTMLDAWKNGESMEDLQKHSPPLYANDTDWSKGRRLLGYQLDSDHGYHGAQLKIAVTLSLQDANGAKSEKKVNYLIDTHPATVVVRGDM